MKQIVNSGGGPMRLPTEEEVEVMQILLNLPQIVKKSEQIRLSKLTWGAKKKRCTVGLKPVLSPAPSPEKFSPEKSPKSPLCFFPGGSGSDGGGGRQSPAVEDKKLKRKATDELVECYNRAKQEREVLLKDTKGKKALHQELIKANLELKAVLQQVQKVNYPRNIEWNNCMKTVDQQQSYHPHMSMFVPSIPQQHCQGSGRFGLFNQIDPRVNIKGETYDFMASSSSQPLDQSRFFVEDDESRIRAATAARKRRIMRMQVNKRIWARKQSRGCCRR